MLSIARHLGSVGFLSQLIVFLTNIVQKNRAHPILLGKICMAKTNREACLDPRLRGDDENTLLSAYVFNRKLETSTEPTYQRALRLDFEVLRFSSSQNSKRLLPFRLPLQPLVYRYKSDRLGNVNR